MIWREFKKYGRQFRSLILFYMGWVLLATFLTSTHQAFVSPSAGVRAYARFIETLSGPLDLLLLLFVVILMWMEDSLWQPKAFWQTRPVSPNAQLRAKVLWLVLLGAVVPAAAGFVTTFTAQLGWLESSVFALRRGMFYLVVGSTLCGIALVSRGWQDVGPIVILHLAVFLTHALFVSAMTNSTVLPQLFYLALILGVFVLVYWLTLRRGRQDTSAIALLLGNIVIVPLIMSAVWAMGFLDARPKNAPIESRRLANTSSSEGVIVLKPGFKGRFDSMGQGSRRLDYWHQERLLQFQSKRRLQLSMLGTEANASHQPTSSLSLPTVGRSVGSFWWQGQGDVVDVVETKP